MTLLRARKIVLRAMANHLRERYFQLYDQIEKGRLTPNEARFIGAEIESLEDMASYVGSEAQKINRESVREAAREVMTIWQKETK
ncbi:MAG: hypothetical protein LBO72_09055 [Helicobacteraceae bacterium]|nr:hypothetical protein [Helicobacteraceae bacterium]